MGEQNFYIRWIKPFFDWLFSLVLLMLLFPLILIMALIMFLHFSKNPFFIQRRVGKNEQTFPLIKFRTMRVDFDETSTTALGRFVRSISLDELPQLFNVMKGEMSIVGPRPLLVEYLPYYNEEEKKRHMVRPGITGWAQVNGRNKIDWGERMRLDIYYVSHISFLLDMKIILRTGIQLFGRDKTSYQNNRTIPFNEYASNR